MHHLDVGIHSFLCATEECYVQPRLCSLGLSRRCVVRSSSSDCLASSSVLLQIVQVFDTYAGELGPCLFARYELPLLKAIVVEVKERLTARHIEPVPMVGECYRLGFLL